MTSWPLSGVGTNSWCVPEENGEGGNLGRNVTKKWAWKRLFCMKWRFLGEGEKEEEEEEERWED
jgi:hypothetical protein